MPRKSGAPLSHKRRAQVFVPKVWRSDYYQMLDGNAFGKDSSGPAKLPAIMQMFASIVCLDRTKLL
jgi:hypothetical protein